MPRFAILHPFREIARGFRAYKTGVTWLMGHPGYLALLFVPLTLGVLMLAGVWQTLLGQQERMLAFMLYEQPVEWAPLILFYIVKGFLYVAFVIVSVVTCLVVTNVLSAPIYDQVSQAVERDVRGSIEELGWGASLRLIPEELKKGLFILAVSIILLFIPGVNIVVIPVTAFLLGWDFYDYPLARRGLSFSARLGRVTTDVWAVTAFGLWLMIPLVQIVLMPLAIAGGTMLGLETLPPKVIKSEINKGEVHHVGFGKGQSQGS